MKQNHVRFILVPILLIAATSTWGQAIPAEKVPAPPSVYQSPTFYALFFVAVVLLIYILQLSKVLRAVSSDYAKGKNSKWDKLGIIIILLGSTLIIPHSAWASAKVNEQQPMLDFLHDGFGNNAINALVVIIVIELFVMLFFTRMIRLFVEKPKENEVIDTAVNQKKIADTSLFWDKFNASVSIAEESAVLTDHDYDGIRELDNNLPPWWKYGFYLTIVWTIGYLTYFHISSGPGSADEYKAQIADGERAIAEYRIKAKNLVDETNVVASIDATDLQSGKALFSQHCAQCHAMDGGGQIGPNLTDSYWLHGADIKDIFSTIKYGINGKGMKSWQQELSPLLMAQVASYVKSLSGTTPLAPKAPDGELVIALNTSVEVSDTNKLAQKDTLIQ